MLKKLKYIDFTGSSLQLLINGQVAQKSTIGGFLSLLTIIGTLFYLIFLILAAFNQSFDQYKFYETINHFHPN
jgi:predicted signal transduction protein with EAL and GGDEF domain